MQKSTPENSIQQDMLRQRLPIVVVVMVAVCMGLIIRVISFQFPQDPRIVREFAVQREANAGSIERFESPRGNIYDRNGNPLAVNRLLYRVGISPNVVSDRTKTASDLARILGRDELEIYEILQRESQYELLGIVSPDTWKEIRDLDLYAIRVDRVQRRVYPQVELGGQVIGFVAGDGQDASGYEGVEGYYNDQLSGIVRDQEVSIIPFDLPTDGSNLKQGADLVLTLDRDIQFLIETELERAVIETGAQGGTIIVMNPRNGDILGMASEPSFDPNNYAQLEEQELRNPAIRDIYEPGSVFKILTVAAGLETGVITPEWTYNDTGLLEIGGIEIRNWDEQAYGVVDARQVLVNSLNIGASEIALAMKDDRFYGMLERFGIGSRTQVDLQGEEAGIMRTRTSITGDWSESDLATNSFGQGVSVTPLQMLTAANAIANDGLMMQPRIVYQVVDGETIYTSSPATVRRVISAETAALVTDMMVSVVQDGLDERAQVLGYTVAGKTGTAQIAGVTEYLEGVHIMTFVGFLPADDPQVSVLVKLDRPFAEFASQVAAPLFSRVASRLVLLLEIPTDEVRFALASQGATVGESSP